MAYNDPVSLAGFQAFVRNVMGVPISALPDDDEQTEFAYHVALSTVNRWIRLSHLQYKLAVYNFGGDYLMKWAQDVPPSTYFADARLKLGLNAFTAGVVASSYDESTGQTLAVPDWYKNASLSDMDMMATPWGRAYLAIAQQFGDLWGVS